MGLMHITGHRDAPPAKVGVAVTDLTTGLYTSNSILASLLQRAITGKGQWIDISLSDCQVATLSNLASSHLISGKPDSGRWGTAHPSIVPYKGFETKDGSIMLGGGNDRLFGVLCEKLQRPEWKEDPKFITNAKRVENRELLEELITTVTKKRTTGEWLVVFEGSGMPYAAVNDIAGTMRHEHGMFTSSVYLEICSPFQDQKQNTDEDTNSTCEGHGQRNRPSHLWTHQTRQHARQVLGKYAWDQICAPDFGTAY